MEGVARIQVIRIGNARHIFSAGVSISGRPARQYRGTSRELMVGGRQRERRIAPVMRKLPAKTGASVKKE
jgi:hypothetical protein